jgi:hypothetical protein
MRRRHLVLSRFLPAYVEHARQQRDEGGNKRLFLGGKYRI